MTPMGVRGRLTAFYTAVLTLVLIVYAAVTYVAVRREFQEQFEHHPGDRLDEPLEEIGTVLIGGLPFVVVLSAIGAYVLAGRALKPVEASMEKLRRFTADASHELRTPLSVVRGIGEISLDATRTVPEYKETIGSMLEEVDRLTRLVDALLRLSHADAGAVPLARDSLNLGDLAHDVASSLMVLAEERNQRLTVDADPRATVVADRMLLREAVVKRRRQRDQVRPARLDDRPARPRAGQRSGVGGRRRRTGGCARASRAHLRPFLSRGRRTLPRQRRHRPRARDRAVGG